MKSVQLISERDMLKEMATGKPFSIRYVSYDASRKKGGKVHHFDEAILVQPEKEASAAKGRPLTAAEQQAIRNRQENELRKNPHHSKWYTRNLRVLQDGTPTSLVRKFHPPLVVEFNSLRVVP
ncbi:MAG: hypothetical protein AAF840_03795 [Bacteroidota bacterium]